MKRILTPLLLAGLLLCLAGCQPARESTVYPLNQEELGLSPDDSIVHFDLQKEQLLLAVRSQEGDWALLLKNLRDGSTRELFTSERSISGCALLQDGSVGFYGTVSYPSQTSMNYLAYYDPKEQRTAVYYLPQLCEQGAYLPLRTAAFWDENGSLTYHELLTGHSTPVWPAAREPRTGHIGNPEIPVDENGMVITDAAAPPTVSPDGKYLAFTQWRDRATLYRFTLADGTLLRQPLELRNTGLSNELPALFFLGDTLYIFDLPDESGRRNRYWRLDDNGLREYRTDFLFDAVYPTEEAILLASGGDLYRLDGDGEQLRPLAYGYDPAAYTLESARSDGDTLWLLLRAIEPPPESGQPKPDDQLVRLPAPAAGVAEPSR